MGRKVGEERSRQGDKRMEKNKRERRGNCSREGEKGVAEGRGEGRRWKKKKEKRREIRKEGL